MREVLLSAREFDQAIWRPGGGQCRVGRPVARPHPCRHRAQRRRQVHLDQPAVRRPAADLGAITLAGRDITGWSPERISRQGLGRSYQKTNIFAPFTIWENVRLAAQSRDAQQPWNPLRWLQDAKKSAPALERATRAIALAGLESRRNVVAGASSHGEQRQLEIAMTLATEPQVLLLDEPLAGMGVAEAESMVELLLKLKKDHAMLLVEHDMDAVFTLADHLTVMVNGQVIASGTPTEVRADRGVQAAYLGEEH
jgi:branched-chain amino acid transport system ATP-binding protein